MKFLQNLSKNAMLVGYGVAGGAGGRIITKNVATKIPYIKDKPKLQPVVALLAGAALMDMKGDLMHYAGHGMASVAGVDTLSGYVPAVAYTEPVADDLADDLADDVADILEEKLADDVSNSEAAMNDSVDNAHAAMNDEMNDDNMNDESGY